MLTAPVRPGILRKSLIVSSFVAILCANAAISSAADPIAKAQRIQEKALIQRAGQPQYEDLKPNDAIFAQDLLFTPPDGDSKVWVKGLGPHESDVSLGRNSAFVILGAQAQGPATQLAGQIAQGMIRFRKRLIPTDPPSNYSVFSPTALAVVMPTGQMTDFVVESLEPNRTVVTVIQGELRVSNIKEDLPDERLVRACEAVIVELDKVPSKVMRVSTEYIRSLIEYTTIPRTLPTDFPSCEAEPPPPPRTPLPLDYYEYYDPGVIIIPGETEYYPIPIPIPIPIPYPTYPTYPTWPTVPTTPTTPTVPTTPTTPTVPTTPTTPTIPTRLTIPTWITLPSVFTIPTRHTFPTLLTFPTRITLPTLLTVPTRPTIRTLPTLFTFITIPTLHTFPTFPTIRTFPTIGTLPSLLTFPTIRTVRTFPSVATIRTVPTLFTLETLRTFPTVATVPTVPTRITFPTLLTFPTRVTIPGVTTSPTIRVTLPTRPPRVTLPTGRIPTIRTLATVPEGPPTQTLIRTFPTVRPEVPTRAVLPTVSRPTVTPRVTVPERTTIQPLKPRVTVSPERLPRKEEIEKPKVSPRVREQVQPKLQEPSEPAQRRIQQRQREIQQQPPGGDQQRRRMLKPDED